MPSSARNASSRSRLTPCSACGRPNTAVTEQGKCLECCWSAVEAWAAAHPYPDRNKVKAKPKKRTHA
jgi:hypothetical protein